MYARNTNARPHPTAACHVSRETLVPGDCRCGRQRAVCHVPGFAERSLLPKEEYSVGDLWHAVSVANQAAYTFRPGNGTWTRAHPLAFHRRHCSATTTHPASFFDACVSFGQISAEIASIPKPIETESRHFVTLLIYRQTASDSTHLCMC